MEDKIPNFHDIVSSLKKFRNEAAENLTEPERTICITCLDELIPIGEFVDSAMKQQDIILELLETNQKLRKLVIDKPIELLMLIYEKKMLEYYQSVTASIDSKMEQWNSCFFEVQAKGILAGLEGFDTNPDDFNIDGLNLEE